MLGATTDDNQVVGSGIQWSCTMQKSNISQEEVDTLLARIKSELSSVGIPHDIVDGTTITIIHPDYWEISLFVPCKSSVCNIKASSLRKAVNNILLNSCGVNPDGCDYLGNRNNKSAYEWYFRHPNIPQEINDLIEAEIEAEIGEEAGLGLPIPSGSVSKSDIAFITMKDDFYREIESGRKTTEYRNINQYYCDKFFSPGVAKKFIKLNRGYNSGSGNQMVFEIAGIVLVSEDGREVSAIGDDGMLICSFSKLPSNFAPVAYGIKLGKRVS